MEKFRIMSFDLDSFTLVKSKEERSKRVIDYVRNLDIDIALLLSKIQNIQNVNIDSFCNKYNLDNICSEPRSNHILVSKGLDARVVDAKVIDSVEVQPMLVGITYKKVRSHYE